MRYKWTRITEPEFERLVRLCNFTPVELQIFKLRRKGLAPGFVADEIGYSKRQMERISREAILKIMQCSQN